VRSALTIPNAVSLVRLLAIPYFWWVTLVADDIPQAAVLIFVIGGTDWVDGYLARRLDQMSAVGQFLDPLADRLMIASALVAGLLAGVVPLVIGIPLVAREAVVAIGALVMARRATGGLVVRYEGKVATFLLYGAIPSFYFTAAEVAPWLFGPVAWISGVVGLLLYYWVAFVYARDLGSAMGATGDGPVSSPDAT
jgi:cardiolipin synthase (CMP-forming)